ncbi:MAG: Dynamin family protein [Desulfobacteraceae bacterium]|nr:MAG: Dynamin family protein [Desulfobacteraceae bacterium]
MDPEKGVILKAKHIPIGDELDTEIYRENYINSLRSEMVATVEKRLTPVAQAYGYSDVPLESTIKWRPMVLIIGNYSSGKSTLINEFLGADIQAIGQAPTDDSFTIITHDDSALEGADIQVTQERDGKFLLNDPEYPFEILKKHGQRFASHFRLKKVNSPFLKNLALIDTPGMLDSITERDRGYDYQEVIGDLAQLADLVLVLFDPHKAGTVRESHTSLRETISIRTYEDRVLFVLNRIDECASLSDLLQVYGTLCWNLSQITGRKDIPSIHLTYSLRAAKKSQNCSAEDQHFLFYLQNQRKNLKNAVLEAPRYRLDNLATFIETNAERLDHFLEAIVKYRKQLKEFQIKWILIGLGISLLAGAGAITAGLFTGFSGGVTDPIALCIGALAACLFMGFWVFVPLRYLKSLFHRKALKNIDNLTPLETQTRRDSWHTVRELVLKYLKKTNGFFSLKTVMSEYTEVHQVLTEGTRDIRKALNELSNLKYTDIQRPDESTKPAAEI